jgi:hypothetical protein
MLGLLEVLGKPDTKGYPEMNDNPWTSKSLRERILWGMWALPLAIVILAAGGLLAGWLNKFITHGI